MPGPHRPLPPVPKPAVEKIPDTVFDGVAPAARKQEGTMARGLRRLFGSGAAEVQAPAAVPANLPAALAAVGKVSPKAQQAYDHAWQTAVNGGATQAAATVAGDRARAAYWEAAGVPEALRPMRANERGAQVRRNEDAQLDRRALARTEGEQLRHDKTASSVTDKHLAKLNLSASTSRPVAAPKLPPGTAVGTVLGVVGGVGVAGGNGVKHIGGKAGLSDQAGALGAASGGALTEATGAIGGIMGISAAWDARAKGGAIARHATTELGQGVLSTGAALNSTAKNVVTMVDKAQHLGQTSGVTALGTAAGMMGGATSVVGAVGHAVTAGQQGVRGRSLEALKDEVAEDLALADVIGGSASTHTSKAAISGVKAVGSGLSAAGAFTGGPVTPWGLGLTVAGGVVGGTASAVDAGKDAYNAGRTNEALEEGRYGGGSMTGAQAAGQVLSRSAAHQAETLLQQAKLGDLRAQKALLVYGIKLEDVLQAGTVGEGALVKLIAKQQGRSEASETFGQQVSSGLAGLNAKVSEGGGLKNWNDRRDIRWRTAQAKNLMEYGGRSDRTEGTEKAKGFFTVGLEANRQRKRMLMLFQENRQHYKDKGYSEDKLRAIEALLSSNVTREAMEEEDRLRFSASRGRSSAVVGRG